MQNSEIRFVVEGPRAEKAAEEIADAIEMEFGRRPEPVPSRTAGDADRRKGVDPIAAAALVLAVPGALLAAADLVERLKKRKKVDAVIDVGKKWNEADPETRIRIFVPRGTPVRLHMADANAVIDMAGEDS